MIAPQIGTAGQREAAQGFQSLADRLQSWQGQAFEVMKGQAIEQGREDAINDLVSGNPARIEKGYSFYNKAYNDISTAAFNASTESDMKSTAEQIALQSAGDPEQFRTMFESYSKATLSNIQEPEFKALAMQSSQKILGSKYASLNQEKFKNIRKNENEAIEAGIKDLSSTYSASLANGDDIGATESLAKITSMYEAQINAGEMSPSMLPLKLKALQKTAITTKFMMDLDTSLNEGKTTYIKDFMKSDFYKAMNIEDRQALTKKMYDFTKQKNDALIEEFDGNYKQAESASKVNEANFTKRMYLGEDIPDSELKDALDDERLNSVSYDKLIALKAQKAGAPLYSNEARVTYYETYIESASKAEIARDPQLSWKDRQRLVAKVVSHTETVRGNNELANAFKNQREMFGKTSYQMLDESLKVAFTPSNPMQKQKAQQDALDIKTQVREAVARGEISPTDAHTYGRKLIDEKKAKEKKDSDAKKAKERAEKVTKAYKEKANSTWGKMRNWAGDPITTEEVAEDLNAK
jgi:hypothetical protein